MNCPRDGATLETKAFGASCPTCHGMFFEHGQLNALEPTAGDLEFSTVDGDDFQHADKYGSIACPRDGATMPKGDFNIECVIISDCSTRSGSGVALAPAEEGQLRELHLYVHGHD